MHYVYLLKSQSHPEQKYVGVTEDLKRDSATTIKAFPSTHPNICLGN